MYKKALIRLNSNNTFRKQFFLSVIGYTLYCVLLYFIAEHAIGHTTPDTFGNAPILLLSIPLMIGGITFSLFVNFLLKRISKWKLSHENNNIIENK